MTTSEVLFGSWPSSLSPDALARSSRRFGEVKTVGENVYWSESRPAEQGRSVVVRRTADGEISDATGSESNVRTLVHEYGGGAWTVRSDEIFYVDMVDQQIHVCHTGGGASRMVTAEPSGQTRFADLTMHPDTRHLLAVAERHGDDLAEPTNELVAIEISTGAVRSIFASSDFVSSPRPSPDGATIAFITWLHPNMPWDETELRLVDWTDTGLFGEARVLVSGEALQQPLWNGDRLMVITDRTGWWLPHEIDLSSGRTTALLDAEIDAAPPPWVFGLTSIAPDGDALVITWQSDGYGHLGWLFEGQLVEVETEFLDFGSIAVTVHGAVVATVAGVSVAPSVALIERTGAVTILRSNDAVLHTDAISGAEHIDFQSRDRIAHGLFYRPRSDRAHGPEGTTPPLLVLSHGGPTSAAQPGLNLAIQFWTTRGFAVIDVNYGGSTGYGREYRELLRDSWGIVDVEDCIAAANHLVSIGEVDGSRLVIKGGSAGGYTTLAALAFHDVFAAGASRYGIGDLETLARDTHKFESRYLEGLIGPYPEAKSVYVERSPIHVVDQLSAPMIVLQGSQDKVVPPDQAEEMVEALARNGLAHAYVLFEGEEHGFRKAANIARAIEAEYVFFCRVFGLVPSGDPAPLDITGLP